MKISSIEIFRFNLPLKSPLNISGKEIHSRPGLLLSLSGQSGHRGYGEISPLSGLHRENLIKALRQISALRSFLREVELPGEDDKPVDYLDRLWETIRPLPSVQFGVELALLNLRAQTQDVSLCRLFSEKCHTTVKVNGLLTGSEENLRAEVEKLRDAGYCSVKMKVGRKTIEEDARRVLELREAAGEKIAIRLDANRAWELPQAVEFGTAVASCRIEYIEEPVKDISQLEPFYRGTGIPVALDESLPALWEKRQANTPGIAAYILKPSVIGSIGQTIRLAREAVNSGKKPVFSCAFLSGIGLSAVAQLAAAVAPAAVATGLDTYRWLAEDLLVHPFRVVNGQVNIDELNRYGTVIRPDLVERVF